MLRTAGRRPVVVPSLIAALLAATSFGALPATAAIATVSGQLTIAEGTALSPTAVAIVTIIDQSADPTAGSAIGQQRINGPLTVPLNFAVLYDDATVNPSHAYALFATIVDGTQAWQNPIGAPVITGGPTTGLALTLAALPASPGGAVSGTMTLPSGTTLSPAAISIAALIKAETGTLVSRQVAPISSSGAIQFTIGFVPGLIDPGATYVVKAGVTDGATAWQNTTGVPAISGGNPISPLTVALTPSPTSLPTPSAAPTATTAPTGSPTGGPTTAPTAAPTTAPPTAPPTATPTLPPTASPTASPSDSPSPSPSATASGTPAPIEGPLTGTLTYDEPQTLSAEAVAIVAIVRGTGPATESPIVNSEVYRDIGQKPIEFSLDFDVAAIDPTLTYTVQAAIIDGDTAWITARGVPVITLGSPTEVALDLVFRPDLLKGSVTGQITATGLTPAPDVYALTVIVEPATGATIGLGVRRIEGGLPIPFEIPYSLTDIDPANDYLVYAEVDNIDARWANLAGVPVLTKDNPKGGITIEIVEVVDAEPTPTPSPTDDSGPLIAIGAIVAIIVIGGLGFWWYRRRQTHS